ncbi:Tetratricopeptide TPR_4 [Enhygromyxa salina]|uniref:Tetratricopeptide TPR_4 n=1 Tax=Enhygromyxa salina TaxID=215803 RepID=A0A0C1ZC80_9BACT|nr:CHAT domain-containing protein [Enhygromyxa salina]KIG15294.1 Tetratricopeptide TPR_4 [Enhygromyxa salina]
MASASDRHRHRGLTVALLGLLGCPAQPSETGGTGPADPPDPSDPTVQVDPRAASIEAGPPAMFGCAGLILDTGQLRCLLRKPKPLRAWLDGRRDATIELWFDGAPLASTLSRDRDGLLLEFEPPREHGLVELRAPTGEVWRVQLTSASARHTELRKAANERGRAGDFAGAAAIFATAADELTPAQADLLRCDEARLAIAERRFAHVIALANGLTDSPAISCVGAAASLAAYVQLFDQPDFNAADQHLATATAAGRFDFETAIGARYLRGVFDHRIGDIDESLVEFEASARLAKLVGDEQQFMASTIMQAVALARLGRLREAESLATSIVSGIAEDATTDPLIRDVRYDLAWIALLAREADPHAPDPSATLRELIADYTRTQSHSDVARTRLHLVFARLQSRDLTSARTELDQIDGAQLDTHSLVWFELAAFELALASGATRAARGHLDRAELYADLTRDREHHFRIWAARGALARAKGDRGAALEALRHASTIADELALAVPGSSGRSMMVTAHRQADTALVELLVELDQAEAALCAAVSVRARHLRALSARLRPPLSREDQRDYQALLSQHRALRLDIDEQLADAWQQPSTELQALREQLSEQGERADELLRQATALLERDAPRWSCDRVLPRRDGQAVLAMAPSADDDRGWFMLARRDGEVTRTEVIEIANVLAPGERAAQAIAALGPSLAEVRELEVIPVGRLSSVDFHALLRPREITVVYSLGLGHAETNPRARATADVVAGSSDLPAVASEAAHVSARLHELGWQVTPSWAPASDDQPHLLHYAGHGTATGARAGEGGWDSYIEIPGFGRLSASQIVAGQRAPRIVVLGACSTGAVSDEIIDGGMNLAAAFLLAGAELVIAPTGPVDDQAALSLSQTIYAQLGATPGHELGTATSVSEFIAALDHAQHAQHAQDTAREPTGPTSYWRWRAWQP